MLISTNIFGTGYISQNENNDYLILIFERNIIRCLSQYFSSFYFWLILNLTKNITL